jgi:hypothetical protein
MVAFDPAPRPGAAAAPCTGPAPRPPRPPPCRAAPGDPPARAARPRCAASASGGGEDATCTLRSGVEGSAKSFSYVPVRKRQVEAAEHAAQAAAARHAPPPQSRVRYESISQFSQKVELYRGRCGAAAGHDGGGVKRNAGV